MIYNIKIELMSNMSRYFYKQNKKQHYLLFVTQTQTFIFTKSLLIHR